MAAAAAAVPVLLALLQVEVRGVQVGDWRLEVEVGEVGEVGEKPQARARAPGPH